MTLIISATLALVLTVWLTGVYRRVAIKRGILDNPNHRSSHTVPTPTGGGIVAVIAIMCMWIVAYYLDLITLKEKLALILPGTLLAVIGFLDDRKHLAKTWRFGAQIIAVVMVIALLHPLPSLYIAFGFTLDLNGWPLPFVGLAMLWLINLYNFMDGIDGIAAGEGITVLGSIALLLLINGYNNDAYILLITAIPLFGFLFWNWPPAKIFMGDACSTFLGITLATLALTTAKNSGVSLWIWVVMLSGFWVDATYTLLVRMVTGQNWKSAHRSHLYQKLSFRLNSHMKTTLIYICLNIFYLLPVILLSNYSNTNWMIAFLSASLPIIVLCAILRAGRQVEAVI